MDTMSAFFLVSHSSASCSCEFADSVGMDVYLSSNSSKLVASAMPYVWSTNPSFPSSPSLSLIVKRDNNSSISCSFELPEVLGVVLSESDLESMRCSRGFGEMVVSIVYCPDCFLFLECIDDGELLSTCINNIRVIRCDGDASCVVRCFLCVGGKARHAFSRKPLLAWGAAGQHGRQ